MIFVYWISELVLTKMSKIIGVVIVLTILKKKINEPIDILICTTVILLLVLVNDRKFNIIFSLYGIKILHHERFILH